MKTKTRSRVWAILGTIVMVLPLLLGLGSVKTSAEDEPAAGTVNINLHKLQFDKEVAKDLIANDGTELSKDKLGGGTALKEVTFSVYNVTSDYWKAYAAADGEAADKEVAASAAVTTPVDKALTTAITDDAGLATFNLPEKTGDQYSVYLFIETPKDGVSEVAAPLVVALPVDDPSVEGSATLNKINLYPKNEIKVSSIDFIKVGSTSTAALKGAKFNIQAVSSVKGLDEKGAEVDYSGKFVLAGKTSTGMATYGKEPTEAVLVSGDTEVEITGLLDGNYKLIEKEAPTTFVVDPALKDSLTFTVEDGKLVNNAGVKYEVSSNYDFGNPEGVTNAIQTVLDNTVTVENLQDFGSFKFTKKDVNDPNKILPGAKFRITKTADTSSDYLMVKKTVIASSTTPSSEEVGTPETNEETAVDSSTAPVSVITADNSSAYSYAWSSEVASDDSYQPVELTSDANGEFSISGLKLGTYQLEEITAPEGYALPSSPFTPFKVNLDDGDDSAVINNQPKGILPHTGGMGIVVFVAVGAALVAGVAFYFIKRRQETEA